MKNLLLIGLVFLVSCTTTQEQANANEMVYLKDTKTNLCFAAPLNANGTGYDPRSITCVPCDSLKNVTIYNFKK